jgi:hypothetical protein
MDALSLLVVAAMFATLLALGLGIATMATGGMIGHSDGTQWMARRVALQAAALALILLAFLI